MIYLDYIYYITIKYVDNFLHSSSNEYYILINNKYYCLVFWSTCVFSLFFFSLSDFLQFFGGFFLPSHQNTWCMFFKFFIMTAHRRSYIKGQNPGAGSFCCSFSPVWTPLPLLPKGSFYGVGVACWHHTPVSSAGEGGVGGRAARVAERSCGRTAGRGSFSATHCFVIVPVAFCPQLSSRKATRRGRS